MWLLENVKWHMWLTFMLALYFLWPVLCEGDILLGQGRGKNSGSGVQRAFLSPASGLIQCVTLNKPSNCSAS